MRKKLGTRFPASRIKKIMQADEDVGKIALAVPLLVSKALELFLQDLCDRTYEITLQRGAKTVNSLHLKQCVRSYSAFDFLTDVVNKVPNLGGTESGGDEKGVARRRKTFPHDEDGESNEDLRSAKMAMRSANVSPRGRGRGRRGRGRPPTRIFADDTRYMKFEDDQSMSPEHGEPPSGETEGVNGKEKISLNGHTSCDTSNAVIGADATPADGRTHEEFSRWALPDVSGDAAIPPANLPHLTMKIDEDEDYDNED